MKKIAENPINIPRYPPEFEQIITAKNHNFVGREFVFTAINNFLNQYNRGYFTIIGEPGSGKSAILAHYVSQNPGIVYYNIEIPQKNRTEEFFKKTCAQLIEIAENQGHKNLDANFSASSTEGSGFLSLLLQKISDRLQREQRLVITIDGCDRIDMNNQPRGANLFYLPRYLPDKVYFILTRRPFLTDKSGLLIETSSQSLDLSAHPEQNRADVQRYITNYSNSHNLINQHLLTQIADDETNFMYVSEILSAMTEGISAQNLRNHTPPNLQLYYQNHWQKINLAISKQQSLALEVLNILIQEESITVEIIAERLDEDEYEIKVILDKWREFLHLKSIKGKIYCSLYHPSFRTWLSQRLEP